MRQPLPLKVTPALPSRSPAGLSRMSPRTPPHCKPPQGTCVSVFWALGVSRAPVVQRCLRVVQLLPGNKPSPNLVLSTTQLLFLAILWIRVWTGLSGAALLRWHRLGWHLGLRSAGNSTGGNVLQGVPSPEPLLGASGQLCVQPGPPGNTVLRLYLGESRCSNRLKDWMQNLRRSLLL